MVSPFQRCPEPNNSPSFAKGHDIIVPASIGDAAFPAWAADIYDGDNNTQSLKFEILSNDKPELFSKLPRVSYPSGTLRFTPFPDAEGTAKLTIRLKDDGGTPNGGSDVSRSETFYITITQPDTPPENQPPTVLPADTTTSINTAIDIVLNGSDPDNDELVFNIVTPPTHGIVSIHQDIALYRPDDGYTGLDEFSFEAFDGEASSNTATISINVEEPVNNKPVAESIEYVMSQGDSIYISLQGSDPDGDTISYKILSQPANGYLSGIPPQLEFTPTPGFVGKLAFDYVVSDNKLDSDTATVSITVEAKNQPPVAEDLLYFTNEDTSLTGSLKAEDPEADQLSYSIVSEPSHGTLSGSYPDFIYTPDNNFQENDSFSYLANDALSDSNIASVTISILEVNDAPEAQSQTVSTPEEMPLPITLSGTDGDGDQLSYLIVQQPQSGTLEGDNNQITYTPDNGFSGSDTFTFRVSDGFVFSEIATVTVLVNNINDKPIADAQSLSTTEETSLPVTLTGKDPEGDVLSFKTGILPKNGTISGVAPNLIYTPDNNFSGTDSFTFVANDGELDSPPATIEIEVRAVNDKPEAYDQALVINENDLASIALSATDPDGDVLTTHIVRQPDNGFLSGSAFNWTYQPDMGFSGSDSFDFIADDGLTVSDTATVSIGITPVNDAPTADNKSYKVEQENQLILELSGTDPDSDPLEFTVSQLPAHGTLTGDAPSLIYTPESGFKGQDSVQYLVNDGSKDSMLATIDITVLPQANRAPVANAGNDITRPLNAPLLLDGTLSSDEDGNTLSFRWSILESPAGSNAIINSPNSSQASLSTEYPGTFLIELIVNDGDLDSFPDTVVITVTEPGALPVADAGPDAAGNLNTPKLLDGSRSYAAQEGAELSYYWSLSNSPVDSTVILSDSNAVRPQFVADKEGVYSFSLVVSDGYQSSIPDEVSVTISPGAANTKPVAQASFSINYNEAEDKTIYLDGSESFDADGDTLTYQWTVTNHHPDYSDRPDTHAESPQWISEPYDQLVELIVNDGFEDSDPVSLIIPINASFTPQVYFDDTTLNKKAGDLVAMDVYASDHDSSSTLTYQWQLIEQPVGSSASLTNTSNTNTSLVLDVVGRYRVQITVDDGTPNGLVTQSKTIFARSESNNSPVADAGVDQSLTLSDSLQRVVLNGTSSHDPDGDPLNYLWRLSRPVGSLSKLNNDSLAQPAFSPDVPGEYLLSLWVDDGQQQSIEDEIIINISTQGENVAPVANAGENSNATTNTDIILDGSASFDANDDPIAYFWRLDSKPSDSSAELASDQAGQQQPVFVADKPGIYVFKLTVNDYEKISAPDTVTLTVTAQNTIPVAVTGQNIGEYHTVQLGQVINLNGSQSYDPDGDPITFHWTILEKPEGSVSPISNPVSANTTFTADIQGHYKFGLRVNDGLNDSILGLFSVRAYSNSNSAPVAITGEPLTDFIDTVVQLDGSQAFDPDGDSIVSRRWQVVIGPGGANIMIIPPWDESPVFLGDKPGTYLIGYTISDGQLSSDISYQKVTLIGPTPPIAKAGDDTESRVNSALTLEGRFSSDADGDKLSYQWQIMSKPSGSQAFLQSADTSQPVFTADTLGEYTIQLNVSDGFSTSSDQLLVTLIPNQAPVADAGENQTVEAGDPVQLGAGNSYDPEGDDISYHWSLSDKPTGSLASFHSSGLSDPIFITDVAGDYTVQLIVNDGELDSIPDAITITAERYNAVPTANAGSDLAVTTGRTVTLDGSLSSDPDGDALSYQWTITSAPDGSTGTLVAPTSVNPDFTPDKDGIYTIQLIVNDGQYNSSPSTLVINSVSDNTAPEAYASYSHAVITGDTVQVSGWASDDPDGDTLSYQWQFIDKPAGSIATFNNSQILSPNFGADKAGTYTIQLKVSDGIVLSEPHSITITATDGHADLPPDPGDAGKQTLLGIDSDVDGVRDDIQRHIWATYPGDANANVRNALMQIAKHYERVFSDLMSHQLAYTHAVEANQHSECLASLEPDSFYTFSSLLHSEILNTKDRYIVYQNYNDNLEGQFFMSNPIESWSEQCSFPLN